MSKHYVMYIDEDVYDYNRADLHPLEAASMPEAYAEAMNRIRRNHAHERIDECKVLEVTAEHDIGAELEAERKEKKARADAFAAANKEKDERAMLAALKAKYEGPQQ